MYEPYLNTDADNFGMRRAAELLDALPDDDDGLENGMISGAESFSPHPAEIRLEQDELPEYLMAKAFLDCHEPRRCAAVFLPESFPDHGFPIRKNAINATYGRVPTSKCKVFSQKSQFLAWYALLMAGDKEKVEELDQVLGPSDSGAIENKQLAQLRRALSTWLEQAHPEHGPSQGWLEYLYCLLYPDFVDLKS